MENNEQLLKYDENIGLYDHINPILNLKDLNRKQTKELAKEIANNESQTHSWQEVLNDAVNYDSKNKRQEKRFKRIFNKQLNENLAPILEKQHKQELIDRMKSGDASAMSQWTTEGINKFGHQFMPVMLTAATLPFGIGAFGQAANTIGLLPALGAEAGSWGLGYGGYKLGSKLDDDFGTNWIAPALSVASGIGGYGTGYKGMVKLGSRGWLPKGDKFMYGSQFVGDVATDAFNKGINPKSTIQKYRLSKLMDLNTSNSFVKDNLWFSTLDDDASNILIHGDGAATGVNNYKKVDNIGGHPLTSMKGLPHFKDKHLVPANTDIEITGGMSFNKDTHPIFWSKYRPWHETTHTGREMSLTQKARDLHDDWKKFFELGEDIWSTNHPYRYVTIDSSDLPIKFTEGLNTDGFYPHSVEYFSGKVPMEKLKGYEWDPLLKTWGRVQYVDPSKPISKGSYSWFERPSELTLAERMGIPKRDRANLTQDQLEGLEDLMHYNTNGKYRWRLNYNDKTGFTRTTKTNTPEGSVPGVKALLDAGAEPKTVIRYATKTGNWNVWPTRPNTPATFSGGDFPIPEGMGWAPGDLSLILDGNTGKGLKVVMTSPRVDLANSLEDASQSLIESLPNTIDKNIMRRFWQNNDQVILPGSYLSGDNGTLPLGLNGISAIDQGKGMSGAISEILHPTRFRPHASGLSPDSMISILKQGQRPKHAVRYGPGFTQLNNSAVYNKHIYDAWTKYKSGAMTADEFKTIFDDWFVPQGGRPLEIRTPNKFRWARNNDGTKTLVQQDQTPYIVFPHPYVHYKKLGGKLENGK